MQLLCEAVLKTEGSQCGFGVRQAEVWIHYLLPLWSGARSNHSEPHFFSSVKWQQKNPTKNWWSPFHRILVSFNEIIYENASHGAWYTVNAWYVWTGVVIICCIYLTGQLWGWKGGYGVEMLSKLWNGHPLAFPSEMRWPEDTGKPQWFLPGRSLRIPTCTHRR